MDKGGLLQLFWWFLRAEESLTILSFEEGFDKLFQKLRRKGEVLEIMLFQVQQERERRKNLAEV